MAVNQNQSRDAHVWQAPLIAIPCDCARRLRLFHSLCFRFARKDSGWFAFRSALAKRLPLPARWLDVRSPGRLARGRIKEIGESASGGYSMSVGKKIAWITVIVVGMLWIADEYPSFRFRGDGIFSGGPVLGYLIRMRKIPFYTPGECAFRFRGTRVRK